METGQILKDIGLYKNRLLSLFLKSDDLVQAVAESNPEDNSDDIVYKNIFPYLYVDETQTEVKTYLCLEVLVPSSPSREIKTVKIIIWAYCHKNCMRYSKKGFVGPRVDIIADMIERILRNSDLFGIGKVELANVDYISPANKFYGKQLIFYAHDFKIKEK